MIAIVNKSIAKLLMLTRVMAAGLLNWGMDKLSFH
jgi:hypothetical protein